MQICAKTIRIVALLSIFGIVSACQSTPTPTPNPYEQFFEPVESLAAYRLDPRFRVVEASAPPQIIPHNVHKAREMLYRYLKNNFHLIGDSTFNGPYVGPEGIIDKALEVGATHVLYWVAEADGIAVQSSQVVTSTSNSNATIGNPYISNSIPVRNTTRTRSSVPVTQNVRMFDHSAGFLIQIEPTSLYKGIGMTTRNLSDKMKLDKKIDYGVAVRVVSNGSIAQRSGFIRDDVILRVNGNPVYQTVDLPDIISDARDRQEPMTFEILRADGRELTRIVNFQ
jgi:hypothetical protein